MAMISILIPTHNRTAQLQRAIQSVRDAFTDIDIIVGDNSSIQSAIEQNIVISKKYNCKYLALHQYEANIYKVYLCLLEASNASHVLILEDDDILVNPKTHILAQNMAMSQNCIVSFNAIDEKSNRLLYKDRLFQTTTLSQLPIFWNGQFQMGVAYYNKKCLIDAINEWCKPDNTLDFSNDECLVLLCMAKQKKYAHLPFVGSVIDKTESISHSKEWSIFACRKYIDTISHMLGIDQHVIEKWKQIQLRELVELCGKDLAFDDVFANSSLMDVEKYIVSQLDSVPLPIVRQNATQLLQNILKNVL